MKKTKFNALYEAIMEEVTTFLEKDGKLTDQSSSERR
jgi:hypothetical protein